MLASPTPDALWSAPPLRLLRPAAVSWAGLRRRRLLDGCTLAVPAGTRLLVVGEPEESASELVRVLAGLSPRGRGRVEIAGLTDASASGWGRHVAHVGPEPGIPSWMTPAEALGVAADLLDLPPSVARHRREEVTRWTGLDPRWLDRPVRQGGRALLQRTALAAALLGDPEVLLLDDPLRDVPRGERSRLLAFPGIRRTVILASRDPASEAGLVTHVALIRGGRVVMVAAVGELDAAGVTLSRSGLALLADRRAGASPFPQRERGAAAR